MAVLYRRGPEAGAPTPFGGRTTPTVSRSRYEDDDQPAGPEPSIEEVVAGRMVTAEFQPIVHLDTREIVAYEAFARGPAGTRWEKPALMFRAAKEAGIEWELDLAAHAAAFKAALKANLHPSTSLFINANPASVGHAVPEDLAHILATAYSRLRVFMEMSEQSLSIDPSATLSSIEKARSSGWGFSLDNVGLTPNSLALVPFARPDVIKIDVSLVHEQTHPHAPRVMSAIAAHAERTGGSIMALGIETEAHLRTGRGLGAILGQGYLFGRPAPLPGQSHIPVNPIPIIPAQPPLEPDETPFGLATARGAGLPVNATVLSAFAGHLEQRAALDQDPPVVLACLPKATLISGAPMNFLTLLARSSSFIAAVVGEQPPLPVPDVRVIRLGKNDPLRGESTMILIGPHYSAMLTAREQGQNSYVYKLVYDRKVVTRAARIILQRITAADGKPSRPGRTPGAVAARTPDAPG